MLKPFRKSLIEKIARITTPDNARYDPPSMTSKVFLRSYSIKPVKIHKLSIADIKVNIFGNLCNSLRRLQFIILLINDSKDSIFRIKLNYQNSFALFTMETLQSAKTIEEIVVKVSNNLKLEYGDIILINPWLFAFDVSLSDNIFVPLKKKRIDGKSYKHSTVNQPALFDNNFKSHSESRVRERKSYQVIKGQYSNQHRHLNIWDLVFPMLLPPIYLGDKWQLELLDKPFPFQWEGIKFLISNEAALLADEMGTGKTVQTIIALRILFRNGTIKNALILCPLSLIGSAEISQKHGKAFGWDGHIYYWAPEFNSSVTVVRGSKEQRVFDWKYPAHIFITTYETFRLDLESGIINDTILERFDCVILDEAQNIKNSNSKRAIAIRKLSAKYRWCLTGTPIENSIEDVISLFSFIKPDLFSLNNNYSPEEVRNKIKPFMMRRLKKDVLAELPQKIKDDIWIELDSDQKSVYDEVLEKGRLKVKDSIISNDDFIIIKNILHLIAELKKVCNFAPGKLTSPKTEVLRELLESIGANDSKMLIFTQFKGEYGIKPLEELLNSNGIGYVTFHGSLSLHERQRAIEKFKMSKDIKVFLSTFKAGGFGLNLTEASYVVHFDHWWNPATMWQAEDRAHRPGQINSINVYSIWVRDTIEERIKEKLEQKISLIDSVIDSLAKSDIDKLMTIDDWLEVLNISKPKQRGTENTISSIISKIEAMDPIEFEKLAKEYLIKIGYANARTTQPSRDGGVDIFAQYSGDNKHRILVQCKRTKNVGVKVCRELMGIIASYPSNTFGMIITSGGFSADCIQFAGESKRIELIDGNKFASEIIRLKIQL